MNKEQFFEKVNGNPLYITGLAQYATEVVGDDEESKQIRKYGEMLLESHDELFEILDNNDVELG